MSFRWVLRDDPTSISGASEDFETQDDAEAWMGGEWERLLEEGHLAATLMNEDDEIYTMKLTAE